MEGGGLVPYPEYTDDELDSLRKDMAGRGEFITRDALREVVKLDAKMNYDAQLRIPQPQPSFSREPDLVRAELVDALRDYAQIFHEKARMETVRADNIETMARNIEAGGAAEQPDVLTSQEFARAYHLLEMRFEEVRMRVNRLLLE